MNTTSLTRVNLKGAGRLNWVLHLSPHAYEEIISKLHAHQVIEQSVPNKKLGVLLDMSGIAIRPEDAAKEVRS